MAANLALIGCGAIAPNFYLPALAKLRAKFGNIWLLDLSDGSSIRIAVILYIVAGLRMFLTS